MYYNCPIHCSIIVLYWRLRPGRLPGERLAATPPKVRGVCREQGVCQGRFPSERQGSRKKWTASSPRFAPGIPLFCSIPSRACGIHVCVCVCLRLLLCLRWSLSDLSLNFYFCLALFCFSFSLTH